MSILFENSKIQGMTLQNRFVRSATWEGMAAEDGACTSRLTELMARLTQGGVGMIITSHAYVRPIGQAGPWQLGVYKDELVGGLRKMTQAVHDRNGRIVLQLAHAGFFANAKLTGQTPLAPSKVDGFAKGERKEMTQGDIEEVIQAFGEAAHRAKEAGFDGVQIHAAHGYLLSQFLSPVFNRRDDQYGGAVERRAKVLMDVLRRVRDAVGKDFPVLVKMNSEDGLEGGITLEDSLQVGYLLQQGGIDAIELSGGTLVSGRLSPSRGGIKSEDKEAYFRDAARVFKENLDVPIILVGGVRSPQLAEKLVTDGTADYISMSRPFIREPDLVSRWASGDLRPALCLSDNQCFVPAMGGEGIYCVVDKKEKEAG